MNNAQKLETKGIALLENSGWDEESIQNIKERFLDFLSQTFSDEMLENVEVVLESEDDEISLDLVWTNELAGTRVSFYDDKCVHWDLYAAKYENGVEVKHISSGAGGDEGEVYYDGVKVDPYPDWALHFYWWLQDVMKDLK